jgi:hypothetical protein
VIDARQFINLRLRGGFVIKQIEFSREPLLDALEREAVAQTRIVGREFRLLIRSGLSEEELSITLYHDILEAASVASLNPPADVMDFNEAMFERAARAAQVCWGNASSENLNLLLQFHGFRDNKPMIDRDKIQFDLIKLVSGERILRLTEPQSGLALEKKLTPAEAVVRQKEKLLRVFEAALARAEAMAA